MREGGESLGYSDAVEAVAELADLEALEQSLAQAHPGATLDDVDVETLEKHLGAGGRVSRSFQLAVVVTFLASGLPQVTWADQCANPALPCVLYLPGAGSAADRDIDSRITKLNQTFSTTTQGPVAEVTTSGPRAAPAIATTPTKTSRSSLHSFKHTKGATYTSLPAALARSSCVRKSFPESATSKLAWSSMRTHASR